LILIGPLLLVNWSDEKGPAALFLASSEELEELLESAFATDLSAWAPAECLDLDLTPWCADAPESVSELERAIPPLPGSSINAVAEAGADALTGAGLEAAADTSLVLVGAAAESSRCFRILAPRFDDALCVAAAPGDAVADASCANARTGTDETSTSAIAKAAVTLATAGNAR
jgi:hypothetical protein